MRPISLVNILRGLKLLRPDLKLHGFGLKAVALESAEIRELLYSCDSMAWSYPLRFRPGGDSVQNRGAIALRGVSRIALAHDYQKKIGNRLNGTHQKTIPRTAGAGNGQGRKPQWKAGKTKAIRVPEIFAEDLIAIARQWDLNLGGDT